MRRELIAQVGADGVLTLALDPADANTTVRVVVETVGPAMSQEEWKQFVESMAGRITDPTFIRQPQGEYEQRDEFP